MIRITGGLYYRGGEWRYSASKTTVHCDHEGCTAIITPTGLEHNGPTVECIYGCTGWVLAERDLCPLHKPLWTKEEARALVLDDDIWESYEQEERRAWARVLGVEVRA